MRQYLKTLFGILVSFFFLWLVLKETDFTLLAEQLTQFDWRILLFGLAIWVGGYGIRAWRWQVLLEPVKKISWMVSWEVLVVGFTANNLLPLRAGEIVRSFLLGKKESIPKTTVFATIAAERLFDGIVIVGLTIIGASAVELPYWMEQTVMIAGITFLLVLAGFTGLVYYNRQTMRIISWMLKVLPQGIRIRLEEFLNVFTSGIEVLRHPKILFITLATSIGIWLAEATFYYLAAISFGFQIGFLHALLIKGILNLGILIPSGPGYVGTFEFLIVETLGLFGINATAALGYALVTHFVEFGIINIPGIWYWIKYSLASRPDVRDSALS